MAHVDLRGWAESHRASIADHLQQHGAILFRGFDIGGIDVFERVAETMSTGGLIDYRYRSTPRRRMAGRVYTSTEYPADQAIPLHNELSYHTAWPMKIWFCCVTPASTGGATPLCQSGAVFDDLPAALTSRFAERGVMYVRNYGAGLDLSCEEVFGTADRSAIEAFCRDANVEWEWIGDRLTTRQRCQAVAVHPRTGRRVWFNQAHLFHVSSLGPSMAQTLIDQFGERHLPRHAYYGDGTSIEAGVLDEIRATYARHQIAFAWERGDLLMLDNMLVAHGREPFGGERVVAVAMAEELSPTR
jgi:alpha-ketoglutarate-dependent taurine dioxygenase